MRVLVFGVCFLTVFYVLGFAFSGSGKVKLPMWMAFWGMIFNIILSYFFIKEFSILGAAYATTITSFMLMLTPLYLTRKEFNSFIKIGSIIKVIIVSLLTYFIATIIPQSSYLFILWSLILSIFHLILLYTLKELNKEDASLFIKIFKK